MYNRHSNQSRMSTLGSFVFEDVLYEDVVTEINYDPVSTYDFAQNHFQQSDKIFKTFFIFYKIILTATQILRYFSDSSKITLVAVPSDGNCLCHCITQGMKNTIEVSAADMMNVIVDYALEHPIDDVPYKYEPTCPDTEPLARAASHLYKINIVIINLDTSLPLVYFNEDAVDSVFLFNMNEHYWLVNIDFPQKVDLKLMRLKIAKHLYEL